MANGNTERERRRKAAAGGGSPESVLAEWVELDVTAAAAAGELAAAFEVDEILERVADVLATGRCPVLIGERGVGKTSIVHELARRALAGRSTPLAGKRILQISFRRRAAGLQQAVQLRPETRKLLDALRAAGPDVVPFLRDLHVAGAYGLEPLVVSLAQRLGGPVIAEGAAGPTRAMFEDEPALHERFVLLTVDEPDLARARRLIDAWASSQVAQGGHRFAPDAIEEALHLAHRFPAEAALPRTVIELLSQTAALEAGGGPVTAAQVIDRFCELRRVPRLLVDPAVPLDLAALEARFAAQVLGQDDAVRAVVRTIGVIKTGLADARRPFGAFLFAGPTGVGKTHLAQLLAESLFGSRERLLRFNMADFPGADDAGVLFGDPDHFDPGKRRGLVTQRLLGHPFAVLLLDEFEKAHARVHDRFLQLVDEGRFINGAGETVSCRSMVIVATTNAGADAYRARALGFGPAAEEEKLHRAAELRLHEEFRIELLNRFDQLVHFRPLSRAAIRAIALRELESLVQRSGPARRALTLDAGEGVLDWLVAHGYHPTYGARYLRRTIERNVTTALAELLAGAAPPPGSRIALAVRGNAIVARLVTPEPREARTPVAVASRPGAAARRLGRAELRAEAERLAAAAAPHLPALAAMRAEASALLDRLNESGLWDRGAAAQSLVDRYRDLDVAIQAGERLERGVERLAKARADADAVRGSDAALAEAIEAAARALQAWTERDVGGGAETLWLLALAGDPAAGGGGWLEQVVAMELAWCRRRGLAAAVAAQHGAGDALSFVALSVEGPGARTALSMECGVHRLARARRTDLRAWVDLLPQGNARVPQAPRIATVKRRLGVADQPMACSGRLVLPARGLELDLIAADRAALAQLLADLSTSWDAPVVESPPIARIYAQDGVGGRDPRTGATVTRLKSVLRGDLDPFLAAYRLLPSTP